MEVPRRGHGEEDGKELDCMRGREASRVLTCKPWMDSKFMHSLIEDWIQGNNEFASGHDVLEMPWGHPGANYEWAVG